MTKQRPTDTLRDGALKATIWRRQTDDGAFYSVNLTRTYTDADGAYQHSDSFSGAELLRIARLASRAYDRVIALRHDERDPS